MAALQAGTSFNFKVVLLGEGCVGKTSLVLRFVENKFNEKHLSTLQASFLNKKINLAGKRVNLAIWTVATGEQKDLQKFVFCENRSVNGALDQLLFEMGRQVELPHRAALCFDTRLDTAGQERFHALGPIYYRDSNGAVLVYDITDDDSFQKVKNWVRELRKMLGSEVCLVIAGNKSDLERDRAVPVAEAEQFASSVGAAHFHTSAKLNRGVEDMFADLARRMVAKAEEHNAVGAPGNGAQNGSSNRRNVVVVEESASGEDGAERSRSCCGG